METQEKKDLCARNEKKNDEAAAASSGRAKLPPARRERRGWGAVRRRRSLDRKRRNRQNPKKSDDQHEMKRSIDARAIGPSQFVHTYFGRCRLVRAYTAACAATAYRSRRLDRREEARARPTEAVARAGGKRRRRGRRREKPSFGCLKRREHHAYIIDPSRSELSI